MSNSLQRVTIRGDYGLIPQEYYNRKQEFSNYPENPDILYNHNRNILIDYGPSPLNTEESTPRTPEGNKSAARLNFRHYGTSSGELPFLPDGSFTNYDYNFKDPRPSSGDPVMRNLVKQSEARAQIHRFSSEGPLQVTGGEVMPSEKVRLFRTMQGEFKKRFINYDESKDNMIGISKKEKYSSDIIHVEKSGAIIDLTEATANNRLDSVGYLSNKNSDLSYLRSVPDHRVKISDYSIMRKRNPNNVDRSVLNQSLTDFNTVRNLEQANKKVAQLIVNSNFDPKFSHSNFTPNTETQQKNYNSQTKQQIQNIYQDVKTSHNLTDSQFSHKNKTSKKDTFILSQNASEISTVLASSIVNLSNKKHISKSSTEKVRQDVLQSAANVDITQENKNKKNKKLSLIDNFIAEHDTKYSETIQVKNYKGIKPVLDTSKLNTIGNQEFNKSENNISRKLNKAKKKTSETRVINSGNTIGNDSKTQYIPMYNLKNKMDIRKKIDVGDLEFGYKEM